jgi:ketosteroid isomerase-like protein
MSRLVPPLFRAGALLLVVSALGCAAASQSVAVSSSVADQIEIRNSLASLNRVCGARDLGALMALFDDGDDIVLVGSDTREVFRGRAAIEGFVKLLFGLPFTFSFEFTDTIIRSDGNVAWVFVDGAMLHTREDGTVTRSPYRISLAMAKRDGHWRWQLFHGSVPGGE